MKNLLLSACCLAALAANADTYTLVGRRYLRLYSAAEATPVYNAETDAQKIVREMCNVPWTRSDETNAVSTSHANESLDENVARRQRFDAAIFCSGHTDSRHVAHANAACYVYRLPDGSLPNLTSLSATLTCDPYNALGARLVLMTSDSPDIPTDCQVVRGESGGGVKLEALAPRITRQKDGKDYWYPNTTNAVFSSSIHLRRYLFLFVLMENYSMSRGNWLEGCVWIENAVSISTDAPVPGWTDGATVNLFDAAENPAQDDGDVTYVDPFGDAVSSADRDAYLLADGYRTDTDNDGLSNFMEYLSSTVLTNDLDTPVVRADRRVTNGVSFGGDQAVPDYFLPVGSTYLGAMLTDHDFIEDWFEDSAFFKGERHASRYDCDADKDFDDNGWDNWSEARAYISSHPITQSSNYQISNPDSFRPSPTGRIKVVYNGKQAFVGSTIVVQAYRYRDGKVPDQSYPADATWTLPITDTRATYELGSVTNGYVCGGKNMFVVWAETKATDGVWTPGEPYGIVPAVEVGYQRIADSEVELTDVNPSIMRIDLANAAANNTFDAQIALNDRGVNAYAPSFVNEAVISEVYSNVFERSSCVRLRVVRLAVNDKTSNPVTGRTYYAMDEILDTYVDVTRNPFLTESVLVGKGQFDLDWGNIKNIGYNLGYQAGIAVSKVTYGVLLGDVMINFTSPATKLNLLSTVFANAFEPTAEQTAVTPGEVAITENRNSPTFSWTHPQLIKDYPAFRLRIWDGATVVYDSNVQRAPLRDANGAYRWTAPVCVGRELVNGKEYSFSVSMLDAKFTTPNATETKKSFTMNVSGLGGDLADGYSIYAAVKYFGPVTATTANLLVEAFESPDFVGLPAAAAYVTDVAQLASTTSITWNAQLIGLKADTDYYVRAFIDSNTNGVKDATESWGYGNYVGSDRKDLYTPRAYRAKYESFKMPLSVIYIEDVSIPPVDIKGIVSSNLLQNVTL